MQGFFGILWLDILILICILISIYLIYKIILFTVNRAAKTGKIPLDVVNGIKLLLRLIMMILFIIFIILFTQLPAEVTLAISAIFGTVIGFASIQAIQNFISGLYIIITRPFGVNDLIAIGNIEGIIIEISLNYTKLLSVSGKRILISNRNILNSSIVNYTKTSNSQKEEAKSVLKSVKHIFAGKEITQYAFSLELPRDKPIIIKNALKDVANEWEPKFGYKPEYSLWGLTNFAVFRFILTADKPETILQKRALFIQDIYQKVFSKNINL